MANYYGVTRTNYFRVTDEESYKRLYEGLVSEEFIEDFTYEDKDGNIYHGFGSYGVIDWIDRSLDEYECDFYYFLKELQKILPDDEAFIFMESGYEKLRYVTGVAIVVTNKEIRSNNISNWAIDEARDMLGNPKFQTKLEF